MISIIVIVFLVNLAIYLINTVGANTIDTLVRGCDSHLNEESHIANNDVSVSC